MRHAIVISSIILAGCGDSHPAGTVDGSVGDGDGSIGDMDAIPSCPTGQWCLEPSPTTQNLRGIHALDDDVFAVGDDGVILRRRANAWTVMPSGTTESLRDVWAASATDAWAVGQAGTILQFDGSTWSPITGVTTIDLEAIWGSSATDVWMVGSGTVLHFDGSSFTTTSRPGILLDVSGSGPTDVWATGETAQLQHFDGTTWATVNPNVGGITFFSILAMAANRVWIAGAAPSKETHDYNGTTWTAHGTSSTVFQGLHGVAANDVWGVGGTKVGHWNGSDWTIETPAGAAAAMWAVSGVRSSVWVVGDGALIAHFN